MTKKCENQKALLQNLLDAGCCEEFISNCMNVSQQQSEQCIIPMLNKYRSDLLDSIHDQQDKLECLDYLIYSIKKNKKLENI